MAGGTERNLDHLEPHLAGGSRTDRLIMCDAQTSGGLLFSCDPAAATEAVTELRDGGHMAEIIGGLQSGTTGQITLRN